MTPTKRWCTQPGIIWSCFPCITLVTTLVIPRREISVIVLTTNFKQMRVICNELSHYSGTAQRSSNWFFPQFNRTPRLPEEIPGTNQNVVACRNTWQRTGVVIRESNGTRSKTIKIWRIKISATVCTHFMAIQTVEQQHHHILWCCCHGVAPIKTSSSHFIVVSNITSWLFANK